MLEAVTELLDFPDEPLPSIDNVLSAPSFAQIGWIKRNVQAIGGTTLAEICRPEGIAYPAEDGFRTVMVNTCGCGNETIALIPSGGEAARVCLVCDGAIEWPRLYGEEATGTPPEGPTLDPAGGWLSGP